ncbi:cytoplasmic dynein 2 light intermediate chain 1 [Bradysia coprophila]|uniref:cytoplasmic dynein 2 light intermediate chain 1 n=1 Tax=Bradysia coprophila TaxID=38358 RepID=UPI00187D982F|nr:cytoplasmic dynein 2 light intermediate chain 1 [Bradysia coprophila]
MIDPSALKGSIQDIAIKVTEEQLINRNMSNDLKEKTIFVLGSKSVGKTSIINNFLDRDDPVKPTLALEYSFGRRSGSGGQSVQKHICNVWELGSLVNSHHLMEIPIKSHGFEHLNVVIVVDLSQPERLWKDLEESLNGLKQAIAVNERGENLEELTQKMKQMIGIDHPDRHTLDVFPFPVMIVGGKYDQFQNMDPEIKKHVCRCLRSVAHTIGASLLYYSSSLSQLSKILRDSMNHFGFGSPSNPFRTTATDYNGPIIVWHGQDSWKDIGVTPSNSERIGMNYSTHIPQKDVESGEISFDDPAMDPAFREPAIDELRAQKDEELLRYIRDTEIRSKFEIVKTF